MSFWYGSVECIQHQRSLIDCESFCWMTVRRSISPMAGVIVREMEMVVERPDDGVDAVVNMHRATLDWLLLDRPLVAMVITMAPVTVTTASVILVSVISRMCLVWARPLRRRCFPCVTCFCSMTNLMVVRWMTKCSIWMRNKKIEIILVWNSKMFQNDLNYK